MILFAPPIIAGLSSRTRSRRSRRHHEGVQQSRLPSSWWSRVKKSCAWGQVHQSWGRWRTQLGVFDSSIDRKAKRQLYRHHFSSFFKLVACKNLKFKTPKNFKHVKFKNSKDNSIVILVQLSLLSQKNFITLCQSCFDQMFLILKTPKRNLTSILFLDFFGLVCPFRVNVFRCHGRSIKR